MLLWLEQGRTLCRKTVESTQSTAKQNKDLTHKNTQTMEETANNARTATEQACVTLIHF